ncbi:MAG: hypothetical protein HQK49_17150 [Oligoflexia bacterium]|nr:hypothetical protein [Oligoflexia bacterium]
MNRKKIINKILIIVNAIVFLFPLIGNTVFASTDEKLDHETVLKEFNANELKDISNSDDEDDDLDKMTSAWST